MPPPYRATRNYRQHLFGTPAQVFPLLCPVRECDWIEGWEPLHVLSNSGLAEPDCVFVTPAEPLPAVWMITRHDIDQGEVEMIKVTPGVTACKLSIRLTGTDDGCDAEVTYSHTSLGPAGDRVVDAFTEAHYQSFMRDWEARLNHYLRTGSLLRGTAQS